MTREGLCILFYAITFSYLESEVIALFIYIPRLVFTPEPDLLKFEISRVEFKKTPHNIILPIQPINSTTDILLSLYGEGRRNASSFNRYIEQSFKTQ